MTTNNHQYKVGDRVEKIAVPASQGTVVGFNPVARTTMVQWDGYPKIAEEYDNTILLVGQSKVLSAIAQIKINETSNALEVAYKLWQEAKQITKHDIYVFESAGFLDTQSLEKAIENWGWNSSSLYC